jgi:Zn finger protein HypA/HybF involved in hydrogenase expression
MHELSITRSILETVLAHARAAGVQKVLRIHLVVGELNEFKGQWIQRYFDYLSRNTSAEGAGIAVEQDPPGSSRARRHTPFMTPKVPRVWRTYSRMSS